MNKWLYVSSSLHPQNKSKDFHCSLFLRAPYSFRQWCKHSHVMMEWFPPSARTIRARHALLKSRTSQGTKVDRDAKKLFNTDTHGGPPTGLILAFCGRYETTRDCGNNAYRWIKKTSLRRCTLRDLESFLFVLSLLGFHVLQLDCSGILTKHAWENQYFGLRLSGERRPVVTWKFWVSVQNERLSQHSGRARGGESARARAVFTCAEVDVTTWVKLCIVSEFRGVYRKQFLTDLTNVMKLMHQFVER